MTLKEELEILRGEPIKMFVGDPKDIPCIETSNPEKLCRHPVVSVQMCTYNHEPYIRQAIEGVMMQKADFEFELVIGEDCSQDKTREICFEYQKRYPDKIRVLWWHENVSKLGGNSSRVRVHCRGGFIAFCEGDDYWSDPFKLQKQVDILRAHPWISLCCHDYVNLKNGRMSDSWMQGKILNFIQEGRCTKGFELTADEFFCPSAFGQTATYMYRVSMFDSRLYESFPRRCDWVICYVLLKHANAYFINEKMSVYRITNGGVWSGATRLEQLRWSCRMAMGVYETDPTPLSKRRRDYVIALLRAECSPWRQLNSLKRKLTVHPRLCQYLRKIHDHFGN